PARASLGMTTGAGERLDAARAVLFDASNARGDHISLTCPARPPAMPAGPCAQFCFALSALLSPALCAAVDDPASRPPGERPFIGLLLPLNAPEFSRAAEAVRLGCQAALLFAENR